MRKMKNIFKILALVISTYSCTSLVDVEPKGFINPKTAADLRLLLNNTFGGHNQRQVVSGVKLIKFCGDQVYVPKGYRFETESARSYYMVDKTEITEKDFSDIVSLSKVTSLANTVLDILPTTSDLSKEERNQIKGEALVHRAYNMLILVNTHAAHYNKNTASKDLGIPLILTSDINQKIPERSTVKEVYEQIIKDLTEASTLLHNDVDFKVFPSKAAAYALLSRTYLYMGDFKNALDFSNKSLEINGYVCDYATDEFFTASLPKSKEILLFKIEDISYDPQKRFVGLEFMKLFELGDIRMDNYMPDPDYPDAFQYQSTFNHSGVFVSEMYLTRAECYARNNKLKLALDDLNAVRIKRFMTDSYLPLQSANKKEVINWIFRERKIELAWKGLRWFDMKRLNIEIEYQKTITRKYEGKTLILEPNTKEWIIPFPSNILEKNILNNN
jgi:tetratricopeptide (TPR) repeat protein